MTAKARCIHCVLNSALRRFRIRGGLRIMLQICRGSYEPWGAAQESGGARFKGGREQKFSFSFAAIFCFLRVPL